MSNSDSPLHIAVRSNNIEIVKVLLENQCDIHATDAEGRTPLQLATQAGNTEMVALLLQHGAGSQAEPTTPRKRVNEANTKNNTDFGRLLYTTGTLASTVGGIFGRETKRFYENGFESGVRRIPYSDIEAIFYQEVTLWPKLPIFKYVDLHIKTFNNVVYKEESIGAEWMRDMMNVIHDIEQVRDTITRRIIERMTSEIDEKGETYWANDVFITPSSVIQRGASGEVCIPYGEITGVLTEGMFYKYSVTIYSRRTSITIQTHYNRLPCCALLISFMQQHGNVTEASKTSMHLRKQFLSFFSQFDATKVRVGKKPNTPQQSPTSRVVASPSPQSASPTAPQSVGEKFRVFRAGKLLGMITAQEIETKYAAKVLQETDFVLLPLETFLAEIETPDQPFQLFRDGKRIDQYTLQQVKELHENGQTQPIDHLLLPMQVFLERKQVKPS